MNPITQTVESAAIGAEVRLELNSGDVAAKEIDGEILIMNVANGMYYSLDGVSAVAWRLIAAGHSLDQVAVALAQTYGVDESSTLSDITDLAVHLVDEGLVRVSTSGAYTDLPTIEASEEHASYTAPRLTAYSDMADLLALDPPMPGLAETSFISPEEG
ncbi:MAG: PqqD family protein [Gemmatimonadota bacterium]|jgi:hypothetical protein